MRITLPAHPPFSLRSVVYSHGWCQLDPFLEEDRDTGRISYIDRLSSGRVLALCFQEIQDGVVIEFDGDINLPEQEEVQTHARWMLGLDMDFSTFYTLAGAEPKLARSASSARGRILRSPTLFEDVIKTVLTTNTLWAATKRMNKNLITQFGDPLPADPSRKAFPTPESLAGTDEATLRSIVRLGYRAPYVLDLARRVASGSLDLEALKTTDLPTPELRKRLMAMRGVGPYATANLMMLLGRYDSIPIDSWALKMVSKEWHGGNTIGPAEVEKAFERWGDWKGLAYWLWEWTNPSL